MRNVLHINARHDTMLPLIQNVRTIAHLNNDRPCANSPMRVLDKPQGAVAFHMKGGVMLIDDTPAEEWRPVVGYEGYYEVSSLGRVRSIPRDVNHPLGTTARKSGKILAVRHIWSGYMKVGLSKEGRPTTRSVHRIVCESFHGLKPSNQHHAAHLNGVRDDNRAENVAWKTPSENAEDKVLHGTSLRGRDNNPPESRPRGERSGQSKLTELQVLEARKLMGMGISARSIARVMGISSSQAVSIKNRQSWSHI
jgi:hypothetical protein